MSGSVHETFKSRVSVSSAFGSPGCKPHWFQSQVLWGLPSPGWVPRGLPAVLRICELPPNCGSLCHPGGALGEPASLPPLSISIWPFNPLWKGSCSAAFLVFFRVNCSICRCRFGVSVGGSGFRVFLCCHLELPSWKQLFREIANTKRKGDGEGTHV